MYGILRIDPEGYEPADKEYFMTVKEWDSRPNRMMAGEDAQYSPRQRNPDVFTINGKSMPRSFHPEKGSPIIVDKGDAVRVHLVNGGYMAHPLHTHNHPGSWRSSHRSRSACSSRFEGARTPTRPSRPTDTDRCESVRYAARGRRLPAHSYNDSYDADRRPGRHSARRFDPGRRDGSSAGERSSTRRTSASPGSERRSARNDTIRHDRGDRSRTAGPPA